MDSTQPYPSSGTTFSGAGMSRCFSSPFSPPSPPSLYSCPSILSKSFLHSNLFWCWSQLFSLSPYTTTLLFSLSPSLPPSLYDCSGCCLKSSKGTRSLERYTLPQEIMFEIDLRSTNPAERTIHMFTGGNQQKAFGTHLYPSVKFGITLHNQGDSAEFISYRTVVQPTHKHIPGETSLQA